MRSLLPPESLRPTSIWNVVRLRTWLTLRVFCRWTARSRSSSASPRCAPPRPSLHDAAPSRSPVLLDRDATCRVRMPTNESARAVYDVSLSLERVRDSVYGDSDATRTVASPLAGTSRQRQSDRRERRYSASMATTVVLVMVAENTVFLLVVVIEMEIML